MCGPNSPFFQLGKYMDGPIFSEFGIAPFFVVEVQYTCEWFTSVFYENAVLQLVDLLDFSKECKNKKMMNFSLIILN